MLRVDVDHTVDGNFGVIVEGLAGTRHQRLAVGFLDVGGGQDVAFGHPAGNQPLVHDVLDISVEHDLVELPLEVLGDDVDEHGRAVGAVGTVVHRDDVLGVLRQAAVVNGVVDLGGGFPVVDGEHGDPVEGVVFFLDLDDLGCARVGLCLEHAAHSDVGVDVEGLSQRQHNSNVLFELLVRELVDEAAGELTLFSDDQPGVPCLAVRPDEFEDAFVALTGDDQAVFGDGVAQRVCDFLDRVAHLFLVVQADVRDHGNGRTENDVLAQVLVLGLHRHALDDEAVDGAIEPFFQEVVLLVDVRRAGALNGVFARFRVDDARVGTRGF